MAAKPSSIDDIFGPKKGAKAIEAQKFKKSFNSTSTTLTRSHPFCNNSESVVPPLKQSAAAASDTNVSLSQPSIHYSKPPAPRVVQGEAAPRQSEAVAVPNYLQPRANVRTQEEVDAETVLRRARGLVHALNDMESVKILEFFRGPQCCLTLQPRVFSNTRHLFPLLRSSWRSTPNLTRLSSNGSEVPMRSSAPTSCDWCAYLLCVNVPALSQKPQCLVIAFTDNNLGS